MSSDAEERLALRIANSLEALDFAAIDAGAPDATPPSGPVDPDVVGQVAAGTATATKAVTLKLGAVFAAGLLTGTGAGAGLYAALAPSPSEAPAPSVVAPVAVMPPPPTIPEAAPAPSPAPAISEPTGVKPSRQPAPTPVAAPPSNPAGESAFSREWSLLERARVAVTRGRHEDALEVVAEHAKQHPDSQFAQEREALRIQALLGLGRWDEVRGRVEEFERRFPDSPLLEPMRRAFTEP